MIRALLTTTATLALVTPAAAEASTLINRDGLLTYTATTPGVRNDVLFNPNVVVRTDAADDQDPITFVDGCTITYECADVTAISVFLGDGDDEVVGTAQQPMTVHGGPGADRLFGGASADRLFGDAGDDRLYPESGDVAGGGAGTDEAYLFWGTGGAITVSIDGEANDGAEGQGINVLPDVENLEVGAIGPATLIGSAGANRLKGFSRTQNIIDGGAGADELIGGPTDDVFNARDGFPDRIECGSGSDFVLADTLDTVGTACEQVDRAEVTYPLEDRPPTVAWVAGATPTVAADDDRGIASVQFLLGDRVVCTDAVAPYTCSPAVTVGDVGNNALVAIAADGAGQTATAVRTFRVDRFKPRSVALRVRGRVASGKLTLPQGVPCTGRIEVGGRTTAVKRDCTYRVRVRVARSYVAKYLGTDAIAPRSSKRVRA